MFTVPTVDTLSSLQRLALIDMSYSRLDTYTMCPSKYFYTYIAREPRVFGPAAALGNIVHGVLEDTVGDPLDLDHMLERMEHHRGARDPDGQIGPELIETGKEILAEFHSLHEDEEFDVIGKELPFSLLIGSAVVIGYIDLVAREEGRIKITDYKTGRWEVTYKDAPTNLQLGIYALACSQMFPGETIHAELYYLRSGRRKGHTFEPHELEQVYDRVLDQVNGIINDQNFKATEETKPCSFCDFQKNGVCPTGVSRFRRR